MTKITPRGILTVLNLIDWTGHIELGDKDKAWLSIALSDYLNPREDKMRCEACGILHAIVVETALGRICDECIEMISDQADEIREEYDS